MQLNTFFDFCAGIGGGRLGLEQCGLKSVGFSETSRLSEITYALMHNIENEKNFENLKNIQSEGLPDFDILIAGFPCQAFSVVGRKVGSNDDRGQMIFHLARLLQENKPKCFILENVRGLVTHDKGDTLRAILKLLRDCGYIVSYRILSSIEHGLPQMRQHVYFVGIRNDLNLDVRTFIWPQTVEPPHLSEYLIDEGNEVTSDNLKRLSCYLKNSTNQSKFTPDSFLDEEYLIIDTRMSDLRLYRGRVPTLYSHRDGIFYVKNHSLRQLTGYEALLLQGFPKELADKAKYIVSDRHLLVQAGNAMTVNVIRGLGSSLVNLFNLVDEKHIANWQGFEVACTKHLNKKYNAYATFKNQGGSNSYRSDIMVAVKKGGEFGIEAKQCPAQCGQFVLIPNITTQKFDYSCLNNTSLTKNATSIMEHMEKTFDEYKDAGTKGKEILFAGCKDVFASWVIEYYNGKKVKYFITTDYTIFPVKHFLNYFDITATYRVKRSGSSSVGKSNIKPVLDYILANFNIYTSQKVGTKLFVTAKCTMCNVKFSLNGYEYMFSPRGNKFEIRKLSNTFNANVIFSISLKSEQNKDDLMTFEKELV